MPRFGFDGDLAAEQLDALLHSQQAEARTSGRAPAGFLRVEADAVVADDQLDLFLALMQFDPDLPRPRVAHQVAQCFLKNTVAGGG